MDQIFLPWSLWSQNIDLGLLKFIAPEHPWAYCLQHWLNLLLVQLIDVIILEECLSRISVKWAFQRHSHIAINAWNSQKYSVESH